MLNPLFSTYTLCNISGRIRVHPPYIIDMNCSAIQYTHSLFIRYDSISVNTPYTSDMIPLQYTLPIHQIWFHYSTNSLYIRYDSITVHTPYTSDMIPLQYILFIQQIWTHYEDMKTPYTTDITHYSTYNLYNRYDNNA